jgi:hypothetical protein
VSTLPDWALPAWDSFPPVSEWSADSRLNVSPAFRVLAVHSAIVDGHLERDTAKAILRQLAAAAIRAELEGEARVYLDAIGGC